MEKQKYNSIFIIYGVALAFNLFLIKYYNYNRITNIILLAALIVITLNAYLSYIDPITSFETELPNYDYVEKNTDAVMSIVTAICLLTLGLLALLSNMKKHDQVTIPKTFFQNFAFALLFSVLIKLIIWMPKSKGRPIRTLRDVKTVYLTFGIVFLLFTLYDFYITSQSLVKVLSKEK
jgi:hypothetical protein